MPGQFAAGFADAAFVLGVEHLLELSGPMPELFAQLTQAFLIEPFKARGQNGVDLLVTRMNLQ